MNTVEQVTEVLMQYLGIKYTWWHEGEKIDETPPFYCQEANTSLPPLELVKKEGVNCAGLINLGRIACNLHGVKGTYVYPDLFPLHELTEETPPIGSVLFRKYFDDEDQGHVGFITSETEFIHSCEYDEVETGVVMSEIKYWKHYFTHWITFEDVFTKV